MGSKARLLDLIGETLDSVDPTGGPVLDLFSGSGVVAAHLARERSVTAVDIQEYARVLAAALTKPARMAPEEVDELVIEARATASALADSCARELLRCEREAVAALADGDPESLCEIVEHGSPIASEHGEGPRRGRLAEALGSWLAQPRPVTERLTLTRFYGGVYFSYEQALRLDSLLGIVRGLPPGAQRDTGLAAVLGAGSECVTSIGSHFAQPIRPRLADGRPKLPALAAAARRRERDVLAVFAERLRRYAEVPAADHPVRAVRADYRPFLASYADPVAVAYADPPYTRDHYSRFYHVLETIALGDDPGVSRVSVGGADTISRGLYRRERHQSPFCIRSQAPDAFRLLFAGVHRLGVPLVLSYSPYASGTAARPQPRLLCIPELAELASEIFANVEIHAGGRLSHSKFNARRLNGGVDREAEVLLVCRP
jgi:adenine-specific DNA-methyltransferase